MGAVRGGEGGAELSTRIKERLLGGPSWEESIWAYRLWTWRCILFGHKLGDEEREYEDVYHVATRRYCERCDYIEVLWSVWERRRAAK